MEDDFFCETTISGTDFKVLCNNRSGFPARFAKNLNFCYFFDLSEVIAAGGSPSGIKFSTNYVEYPVIISPFTQYQGMSVSFGSVSLTELAFIPAASRNLPVKSNSTDTYSGFLN